MKNRCGTEELIFRDGTSRPGRRLTALAPSYFSVEEHSTEELIHFAQRFAKELKFFNLDNRWDGRSNWSGFLGDPEDPENDERVKDLLAYLEDPESFSDQPEKLAWLTRPHLSVFLAFLEMLREPKQQLDELTRRHLDFYFREVLRIPEKPVVPDQVHVLFEPARGVEVHMIPAGTLLYGGKDSEGNDLHYATDENLLVTQARVADIRRVYRDDETGHIFADIPWQEGREIEASAKYHALGMDLAKPEEDNPNLARIGFAISSPLLELSEGTRIIHLTFRFHGDNIMTSEEIKECLQKAFTYSLSLEEDWLKIEERSIEVTDCSDGAENDYCFILSLTIGSEQPAIVTNTPLAASLYPVLIAELNYLNAGNELKVLQQLTVKNIALKVEVSGLKKVAIRNDEGILSPEGIFYPFGSWPRNGSAFALSHRELCNKPLTNACWKVTWKGKPDFSTWYSLYTNSGITDESSFLVSLETKGLNRTGIKLFTDNNPDTIGATNYIDPGTFFIPKVEGILPESNDPFDFPRYFKMILETPDFQHDQYPIVLQEHPNDIIPPPYTPEIQSLELNYTTENTGIALEAANQGAHQFNYLLPFGFSAPCMQKKGNPPNGRLTLLSTEGGKGNLIIGVSEAEATARLSLLFQLQPGFSDKEAPDLQWSYLDQNCWKPVPEKQILVDGTRKLLNAGIVQIELPRVTDLNHQALPAGLYWLRASADNPDAASDLIAIHAQAVAATWVNQGNAADHLDQPLPAESITELLRRDPNISSVTQPYTSFGARPAELPKYYHTRVSERLRHKHRALSGWDYERLVLERFPEVYKVKCLTPKEKPLLPEEPEKEEKIDPHNPAKGDVVLVVIPNIVKMAPFFPLEPRVSNDKRLEIQDYLRQYASPFIHIEVRNPRFEYIRYRMDIRFHEGYDENLYAKKLNEALHRFLCPWAYEASADIAFGSRIFHSEVIYFIEKLPYVDYVVNFKLARQYQGGEDEWGCMRDYGCAAAQYPDSILVSHHKHFIGKVEIDDYDPDDYKGVGYERIGVDHMVQ